MASLNYIAIKLLSVKLLELEMNKEEMAKIITMDGLSEEDINKIIFLFDSMIMKTVFNLTGIKPEDLKDV